jgi:hypothetical protein
MKKTLAASTLMIALSFALLLPGTAVGQVNVNISIGEAPPPVRYEIVPAPRTGYLWAPGYWNWDGTQHTWSNGHWERNRRNYIYLQPEWHQEGDGWKLEKGGWKHGKHKHQKDDRKDGRDSEHDGQNRDEDSHCPPGQAKKGNC